MTSGKGKRMAERGKEALLSLLFPRAANCLCCGDPRRAALEDCLCFRCRIALEGMRVPPEACNRCLSPVKKGKRCRMCHSRVMGHIERVYAPWRYGGEVRALIHAFKFNGCDEALPLLAQAMADAIPDRDFDCIVPVPLHPKRLRQRGVNQALLLAEAIGRITHMDVRELLQRDYYRRPQSRLDHKERRFNVAGAFSCRERAEGLRILLVDDVRTSGNTAHFCARSLREAGAKQVCLAVAAVVYKAGAIPGKGG